MSAARAPARRRPRRWRQDPQGRRARILAAAAREFTRRGFRAARVERIARAARVAEGTVYYLFGSKRGLLGAVGEDYGGQLARAAFGSGDPAVEGIVRRIFRFVRETEGPLAALLLSFDPVEGTAAADANRQQVLAAIEAYLRREQAVGRARGLDPQVAAAVQFGLVESALRDCFLRGDGRREDAYVREVTRCLEAYLGAGGAPQADPP